MSKFLKGTLILVISSLIVRLLGFVNRIVIARFIGGEGVGLYMMALPTLFLVINITQIGLPVAISKFVAEANARGDEAKIKKILTVSLACTFSLSLIFTPAMILAAPWLSEHVFTDNRVLWPLRAIAPIVPIIAISAVLRGYFQGKQNMQPFALSQIIEQVARITFIAVLTKAFLPYGIEYAAAGAMLASIIGELASLLYLMANFKLKKRFRFRKNFFSFVKSGKSTLQDLLGIAMPSMGSRMVGSITWFLEPIVVARSLAAAGIATSVATIQYGELTGYALPLLMLPTFVTTSLATSLIPAVSEAHARGNMPLVELRMQQTLRIAFITGALSIVTLYVLAEPLLQLMYGSSNAAVFIRFLAPFFILNYFQFPLQSILQALNLARAAMFNSMAGNILKIVVIWLLASKESFGIMGAAVGIASGTVFVSFLHFSTVLKVVPFSLKLKPYAVITCIAILGGLGGHYTQKTLAAGMSVPFQMLVTFAVMMGLFLVLMIFTGEIRKRDLARIPVIGGLLSRLAFR